MATIKPKILSHYTYDYKVSHKEEPKGESMTMANEVMSIQDIVKRHAAGLVDLERRSIYIDAELEQIDKFHGQALDLTDLAELDAHVKSLSSFINETREELEEAQEEPVNSEGGDEGADDNVKGDDNVS